MCCSFPRQLRQLSTLPEPLFPFGNPAVAQHMETLSSCWGPSMRTCWALLGGQDAVVLNYFGPGAHQLSWLQKDLTAARAFKDNRLHQPGSHWETKMSHLGILGGAFGNPEGNASPQGQEGWRKGRMASWFASAWTSRAGF